MILRIKLFKEWILDLDRSEKESLTIEAIITDETEKTIQIYYRDQEVWLQKSLVNIKKQNGSKVNVVIPFWLYMRKFSR